jgi:basic amino acid/polyamine antiporter, APA family
MRRSCAVALQLFRTKNPDLLIAEAEAPDRQMKRTLGAFDLTCIGIGAVIGTGIFALIGTAIAGQTFPTRLETPVLNFIQAWLSGGDIVLGRAGAGPAVAISLFVAALACGFAALCYAELASMIPVSGSAYTYSYATLGEIVAWIIGWDLILEYAVGNMAVAVGWSGYFVKLCGSLFGVKFPIWAVNDYRTARDLIAKGGDTLNDFSSTTMPVIAGHPIAINLPALLIVAAVTVLLIYGIRESARTNTWIVIIKVAVVVFFISFGAFMVHPTNWHPYVPNGFAGVMSGAAIIFFAFIGFDAVSTTAEETRNPQRDMPIGIIASLIICTLLYVLMGTVLAGIKKYTIYLGDPAAAATAFASQPWAEALVSAGALAGMTSVLLVFQLGQPRIFMAMARDGLLPQYFSKIHPRFRTPHVTTIWTGIVVGGVAMLADIGSLSDLTNIGTLFAFILVCIGVVVLRRTDAGRPRPFRVPFVPMFPIVGVIFCFALMLSLPVLTWIRFFVWLAVGLLIYFFYGAWHSKLRSGVDTGITENIPPPLIKT